jgi:glycosyltransferase involved in cell wall biosynthesis
MASNIQTLSNKNLPITVVLASKNEAPNLPKCLASLGPAKKIYVLDSKSSDATPKICKKMGVKVIQFHYKSGYPKKRQWALEKLKIETPWILLLDADEVITIELWNEIGDSINSISGPDAFLIQKEFHFLGKRFRFGGFSHSAVLLFKKGKATFERLLENDPSGLDMEVHERLIINGRLGKLKTPLKHEDFKGLQAYLDRHNKYSTWEAALRYQFITTGNYGSTSIEPRLFGNTQERRRYLKMLIIRLPFEPFLWFIYHYIIQLGFLEGKQGWIACNIRAFYIAETRAKLYELKRSEKNS